LKPKAEDGKLPSSAFVYLEGYAMTSTVAAAPEKPQQSSPSSTVSGMVVRLILLALFDVMAIWLIVNLVQDGYWPLAVMLALITIFVNVVLLRAGMYPCAGWWLAFH
jgi:hypothetical protein